MIRAICFVSSASFATYIFEDMLRSDIFLRMFEITGNQIVRLLLCIPYTAGIIVCGKIISVTISRVPLVNRLKI